MFLIQLTEYASAVVPARGAAKDLRFVAREVKFIPNESLENCKRNFIDFKMKCYNN
jgi:hypothetical protein